MRNVLFSLLLWSVAASGSGIEIAPLRAAAEAGDGYAQLNLGAAYDNGIGVLRDPAQAEAWYRRAAEQGIVEAQFNLGHMLITRGRDPAQGARWLRAAAEQGAADAQYLLGVAYAEGLGVTPDEAAARRWLRAAREQGHEEAAVYLATSFPDPSP